MQTINRFALLVISILILSSCGEGQDFRPASDSQDSAATAKAEMDPSAPRRPGNSGLIPAEPGFVAFDTKAVASVASTRLCAVDAVNGKRASDAPLDLPRTGEVKIEGWVLSPKKQLPPELAVLLVGGSSTFAIRGVTGGRRPDVARVFKTAAGARAGYSVRGDLTTVPVGEYKISLLQDADGLVSTCQTRYAVRIVD